MASSAALMGAGLDDTFDSSHPNHTRPDDTAAGITFGSVADSFHSEDYEAERGAQPWQALAQQDPARARTQAQGQAQAHNDFDSLLDETEMSEPDSPPETRYEPPARHASLKQPTSRPTSRANGASSGGSLRPGSSATSPGSMGPHLTRRSLKSAVLDLGGDRSLAVETSVGPGDASGQFRQLNRPTESEASFATGGNGKGKGREDKSVEKIGQNMTLREQEKVRLGLMVSVEIGINATRPCGGGVDRVLCGSCRSSTCSRRRTLTSNSKSRSTTNALRRPSQSTSRPP